jgi:putative oxidoreductase
MGVREVALLGARVTLGGYLAAHGAQKLWGAFEGPGLEAASAGFEGMGLRPGRQMATLAGVSEFAGGVMTAAGVADPIGPTAIAGAMAVAIAVHRTAGPFSQKGGYELAATNLAAAALLAGTGPGRLSVDSLLGVRVPGWFRAATILTAGALSAYSVKQLLDAAAAIPPAAAPPEPARDEEPATAAS